MSDTYYRYQESLTTSGPIVNLIEFKVDKLTPFGAWIWQPGGTRKFVRTDARKRYACPNKDEALISFQARKTRQIKILKRQLKNAERALEISKDPSQMGIPQGTFLLGDWQS